MQINTEIWTAEVVYAGFGIPMLKGGIAVTGDHIAKVGQLTDLQQSFPGAKVVAKGRALTSAPANPHTHLDLSKVPFFRGEYTDFVRHVIEHSPRLRNLSAALAGILELERYRCGAFGDIVHHPDVLDWLLHDSPLPGVAYLEVINFNDLEAQDMFLKVREGIERYRKQDGKVKIGLSPHSAHTVSAKLLRLLSEYAKINGVPMQIHLAESPAEVQLFQKNQGPLAELMNFQTGWPRRVSPVQYLADLKVLGSHLSVVHAVQVDENDVQTLSQSGTLVVACPRSNQNLNCGEFPWALYARHQVEIALGTDSRASSPSLNVVDEALRLWDSVDPRLLVRAATRSGYKVLGMETPRLARGTPVGDIYIWR
jgi:cytosine/adenosine deaminase-related metal-dependent hydrolase